MNKDECYHYVLTDLISKRDQLDKVIESLEKVTKFNQEAGAKIVESLLKNINSYSYSNSSIGEYNGMNVLPAIKKLLLNEGMPLRTHEIAEKLVCGGMQFKSKTPQSTVASILSRALGANDPSWINR